MSPAPARRNALGKVHLVADRFGDPDAAEPDTPEDAQPSAAAEEQPPSKTTARTERVKTATKPQGTKPQGTKPQGTKTRSRSTKARTDVPAPVTKTPPPAPDPDLRPGETVPGEPTRKITLQIPESMHSRMAGLVLHNAITGKPEGVDSKTAIIWQAVDDFLRHYEDGMNGGKPFRPPANGRLSPGRPAGRRNR